MGVDPVGLEASIPVQISTKGEDGPLPDVVLPTAAAKEQETAAPPATNNQQMALRA